MRQAFLAEPVPERLLKFRHEAPRHPAHVDLPPLRDFRRNVLGAGNNRSVPEGSMPSEVWKLIFGCLPDFARDIHEQFFRQLARTGRNPSRWYDVPVLPIDKGNGKPKCQGKRPIARLDSLAKQVHKTFYQACATTPRPDWAFGCIKGRRREEALAIVENNMFRCRRSKRNHAIFFRDAANAFPSLSHEAIAQHVRSQGAAHDLIMDAHANSLLGLRVPGCGLRKLRMARGTRQGDTIAGDIFMDVYHVPLQAYKTAIQDDDLLLEYGNDVIDAAMTTYADDIAELMVADSAEELDDKAVARTALLEAELGGVGCQLEPSKEEVVMRWMGAGAHANRKAAMLPNKVTPGKKLGVARYLGGWVHNNGNKNTEIDKRISAMRVGFWAYAGIWRCKNVSLYAKRLFFKAMVQGAGLSGLEPYLLPKTALQRLERARDHLARRALGRAGWGAVRGDPRHESVPNSLIRARMRIHTIASTLRQRRLRWLHHMVQHPNHHKLYFASMFGRFSWEICRHELDDFGKPVQHAVPALRQMYDDLAAAVPQFHAFQPGWMQLLLECDPSFSWVLKTVELPPRPSAMTDDAPQADARQDPATPPDLGWVVDVQGEGVRCAICARSFDTRRALNMHEVAKHKKVVCSEVQTNQCPKRSKVFYNMSSAKRHFRASRDRPCAVDRGPGNSGTALLQPARHVDRQRRGGRVHAADGAEQETQNGGSHAEPQEARPHDGELGLPSAPARRCHAVLLSASGGMRTGPSHAGCSGLLRWAQPRQGQTASGQASQDHSSRSPREVCGRARVAATFSGRASSSGPDGQASCSSAPAVPRGAARDAQADVAPHGHTDGHGARSHRLQLLEGQEGHQVCADSPVPAARGLGSGDAVHRVRDPCIWRGFFVGRAAEGSTSEGSVNAAAL